MAFTYGFYNSLKGDRRYNAEQVSEIFDGILTDGIFGNIGQHFAVTTANNGMQINVGTGRAWFDHTWSKNDSVMVLNVPASDISRDRYDAVVLEVNHEDAVRANSIYVVQGVAGASPQKPAMVKSDKVKQYPLAYILVKTGATTIEAQYIENAIGLGECPFATGALQTTPIDDLWAQWKGEWQAWFEGIKLQLSGDIVTNLQYQIEERVKIADKATSKDTTASPLPDNKWMTPARTKEMIESVGASSLVDPVTGKNMKIITLQAPFSVTSTNASADFSTTIDSLCAYHYGNYIYVARANYVSNGSGLLGIERYDATTGVKNATKTATYAFANTSWTTRLAQSYPVTTSSTNFGVAFYFSSSGNGTYSGVFDFDRGTLTPVTYYYPQSFISDNYVGSIGIDGTSVTLYSNTRGASTLAKTSLLSTNSNEMCQILTVIGDTLYFIVSKGSGRFEVISCNLASKTYSTIFYLQFTFSLNMSTVFPIYVDGTKAYIGACIQTSNNSNYHYMYKTAIEIDLSQTTPGIEITSFNTADYINTPGSLYRNAMMYGLRGIIGNVGYYILGSNGVKVNYSTKAISLFTPIMGNSYSSNSNTASFYSAPFNKAPKYKDGTRFLYWANSFYDIKFNTVAQIPMTNIYTPYNNSNNTLPIYMICVCGEPKSLNAITATTDCSTVGFPYGQESPAFMIDADAPVPATIYNQVINEPVLQQVPLGINDIIREEIDKI